MIALNSKSLTSKQNVNETRVSIIMYCHSHLIDQLNVMHEISWMIESAMFFEVKQKRWNELTIMLLSISAQATLIPFSIKIYFFT